MKEETTNLFKTHLDAEAVCITTNGFVKRNGENVMGAGIAKQVAQKYPKVPKILGKLIKEQGNIVHQVYLDGHRRIICSFPVKPVWREYHVPEDIVKHKRNEFSVGQQVPGWASTAIPWIIEKSAMQLVKMADEHGWNKILLPKPGCGAGELSWEEVVKPILDPLLDDRFIIVSI